MSKNKTEELTQDEYMVAACMNPEWLATSEWTMRRFFRRGGIFGVLCESARIDAHEPQRWICVYTRKLYHGEAVPIRVEDGFRTEQDALALLQEKLATKYDNPHYDAKLGGMRFASSVIRENGKYRCVVHYVNASSDDHEDLGGDEKERILFEDQVIGRGNPYTMADRARQEGHQLMAKLTTKLNNAGHSALHYKGLHVPKA